MIREHLAASHAGGEKGFRWRGGEITRLEGFSDAVFAFALTLLVVSLEVPKTFNELMEAMRGFAAFGVCFAFLAQAWYNHFRYFRRYGLQTPWVVFLNCLLLFFVLFYVYPLKFLYFGLFASSWSITAADARILFVVYGVGFAAVFLVYALLYLHAWRVRDQLGLNEMETLRTRRGLWDHSAMTFMGLTSALLALALPLRMVGLAGWFYSLLGLYFTFSGKFFGKRERVVQNALSDPVAPSGEGGR
jgi:uncharacterized membrane protein